MVSSAREALRLLEVGPDADADQIRRAYRRKARTEHPDAGGDVDAFQRLQSAVQLLLDRPPDPRTATSPSTGTTRRPSTTTSMAGGAWGEAASPRWHDGGADTTAVDWGLEVPDGSHAWSRDLLAVALAADGPGPISPAAGRSRRPGARTNRLVGAMAADLLASFHVAPAADRGVAGHDVALVLRTPPGRARKRLDDAPLPLGWTKERRPDSTVASLLLHPSRDRRTTALRAADTLDAALSLMDWPLPQWRAT